MTMDPEAFDRLAALRHADVAPLTGDGFRVVTPDDGGTLLLVDVPDLSRPGDAERFRPPFAMVFEEPEAERPRAQGIHVLEHATLGVLPLFLVPVGTGDTGPRYEASFH